MKYSNSTLTIDVTDRAPIVPDDLFVETSIKQNQSDTLILRFLSKVRTGRILWMRFSEDFGLLINDSLWSDIHPFENVIAGDDYFMLNMRLSGKSLESVNQTTYTIGPYTCSQIQHTHGVRHLFQLLPGEPLTEMCLIFRPSLLVNKCGITASQAESLLYTQKYGYRSPWFNLCSMTPAIERSAYDLRGADPYKDTYRLFAEAKALEMLFLYLEQLKDAASVPKMTLIGPGDLQRLHAVRQYLQSHYQQMPSIDELCRWSGFNRGKLMGQFKAEFGKTIYEYLQQLRMEQARGLLQNGFTDIRWVAEEVGYQHQGNFTKAFKQHFGAAPRQYLAAQRAIKPGMKTH